MKKKPASPVSPGSSSPPADTGLQALAWAVASGATDKLVAEVRRKARSRRRRQVAAASAVLVAVLLVANVLRHTPLSPGISASPIPPSAIVSTPASQRLPDGSIVELRDGATIAVAFTDSERHVTLRHGEAHFRVAKNSRWPFIVTANGIAVRAVGTAFSVQASAQSVDVLVTEGRVAVNAAPDSPDAAAVATAPAHAASDHRQPDLIVDAGRRVVVSVATPTASPPPVLEVTAEERKARLSWRVPRLEFSGTPLSEAIPMFNRYGGTRFVLDPSLGRLQLSGTLRADDADSLLLLLKDEFGIQAETKSDGVVALMPR